MQFSTLNIIDPILQSLKEEKYSEPTPIQAQSIPLILKGNDLLGCAQTGTGKTAAFSIPILQLINSKKDFTSKRKIKALIVTPTRELAIQIDESLKTYGRYLKLNTGVIFGGVNQNRQTGMLQNGLDILVATPGRLLDLVGQGFVSLKDVEIFVLDEADRMLDMGFIHDVNRILKVLPEKRQNLFFSATMAPEILKLASTILIDPVKVEVTPVSSTAEIIEQSVYFVDKDNKNSLLRDILDEQEASSVLVFTRTKYGADKVARFLGKNGVKSDAIHGNKSQNNRQRALSNFKNKSIRVLVATDIAARGIDVEEMELVINFELPNIAETYVHRIGRTGRAGNKGVAISFCDFEEKAYLKDIEKLISQAVPVINEHAYPMEKFVIEKKQTQNRSQGRQSSPTNRTQKSNSGRFNKGNVNKGKTVNR